MNDDRPERDNMSLEEATVSNMWEIAAIVELREQKGLCTKPDLYDTITESRRLLLREDLLDVDDRAVG